MAERTTKSWQEVPHFFLLREVNASRMIAWRAQLKRSQAPESANITYTDLLVKVVAETLKAHPRVNASWRGGGISANSDINIGLAVATEDGLIVPVVHRADTLSVPDIAIRRSELVQRAQAGRQRHDDLSGATFTISNLGMYGIDAFNAIIPEPNAAILAVGRIIDRVVPLNGAPAIQPIIALSLSCDHRVVDGARGAQFLGALAELIEEPLGLLS
jgi:pyruvate dehydrogenase E2 component (dihydrolipoamide acetyltransferase)